MNIATHALLPAPAMQNLHDPSGIGYADTLDPHVALSVRVGPYLEIAEGDLIDLHCDDELAFTYTVKREDLTPGTFNFVVLPLDQKFIKTPQITLWYEITKPIGGQKNQSAPTTVPVKLTLPGGTDTNPATPWENERLALPIVMPEGVITSPEGVTVTIAAYMNMFLGDKITLSWHGELIRSEISDQQQVGQPLIIPISKDIIERAGDSDMLEVRYEVRDVVNNWSRWSLPTYVEVEAGNSTLPAPVTPQAPGMELDLDHLAGADVQVLVIAHPDIQRGDELTLLMERSTAEGLPLAPYTSSKTVSDQSSFHEFQVPNLQFQPLTQGRARLKYRVTKPSGNTLSSKSLPLKIVGQTMELPLPRVPVAEQNDGVLDPTSRNVRAEVPPYYFMSEGNDVHLYWMGKTASGANVMYDELKSVARGDVGSTIDFVIPDDKVSVLAGGSVEVYYTVNTFGRAFFTSLSLLVPVSHDQITPLPLPTLKEAQNGILDPANATQGATVVIDATAHLREGEKVVVRWNGPKGADTKELVVSASQAEQSVSLVFASALVSVNDGQTVEVSYRVTRRSGVVQDSDTVTVKILSAALDLPAPTVDTVGPDGVLRPSLITGPEAIARASYRGMVPTDVVRVRWVGKTTFNGPAQTVGDSTHLKFSIPKSYIVDAEGGTAKVSYLVSRNGAETESHRLDLTVREEMKLDTSPVALAGKVYLIPGKPDVLPTFPNGTTVKRTPSGGRPPYTYTSSNPAVAVVDKDGLTSVRGNGSTTITVTDASGENKGYTVAVSGVIHCVGVGSGNLAQVSAAAAQANSRVPTIHELIEIYNTYGNRWPMGNGNYWSSTVAKNVFGAKWYYVKNLNTGKDFMLLHHNASLGVAIR
ncbi:Ig-like domain-containing protein [Pseudomonas sp. NPDC088444]|uniref:Ig-like domain-containing protein n=1 Tax=Pseudomonas sp. NPDC088444 TaxID=3364456 RepID=UPI00384EC2B8